jgi:hypothetical protein
MAGIAGLARPQHAPLEQLSAQSELAQLSRSYMIEGGVRCKQEKGAFSGVSLVPLGLILFSPTCYPIFFSLSSLAGNGSQITSPSLLPGSCNHYFDWKLRPTFRFLPTLLNRIVILVDLCIISSVAHVP